MVWTGSWVVLGALAGWLASRRLRDGDESVLRIGLGIAGAVLAGLLFVRSGAGRPPGLYFYSLGIAAVGAICVLYLYHVLPSGTDPPRTPQAAPDPSPAFAQPTAAGWARSGWV